MHYKTLQKQGYDISKNCVEPLFRDFWTLARVKGVTTRSADYKRFIVSGESLRLNGNVPIVINKERIADVTYL